MEDSRIIELYFERNQDAILESSLKYGAYCSTVAYNVLRSHEDSEECVNDTWVRAWNAIPPERPRILKAYFARITRNLSLNRLAENTAQKRGGNEIALALDELSEVVPDSSTVEDEVGFHVLTELINSFLKTQPRKHRVVFVQRYFYMYSIEEISGNLSLSESNVKSLLFRTRNKLREYLTEEGVTI